MFYTKVVALGNSTDSTGAIGRNQKDIKYIKQQELLMRMILCCKTIGIQKEIGARKVRSK